MLFVSDDPFFPRPSSSSSRSPRSGPRRRLRSECGSSPSPVSRLCPLLRAALPAVLVVVLETAETPLHSPRAVRAHDGWFRQIRLETPTWLTAEGERTEDLRDGRDADRREGHCQPCVEGSAILAIRSYRGSAAGRTCGTPSRPRLGQGPATSRAKRGGRRARERTATAQGVRSRARR